MRCSVIICIFSNFHFLLWWASKRWCWQKGQQVEMERKQKRLKVKSLSKESTLKDFCRIELQLRENSEILFCAKIRKADEKGSIHTL